MKTFMLCITTEDAVNPNKMVEQAMKLFMPERGVKSVSICDKQDVDLSREKRLNNYFDQVEYNINCMKDKLYKLRKEI